MRQVGKDKIPHFNGSIRIKSLTISHLPLSVMVMVIVIVIVK